jgi:aromatic-L-amino-acid/L-tryptophan decarboxylase
MNYYPATRMESLVIYVTSQTHSFGKKAGLILGLKVRALPVDANARNGDGLDAETLRAALEEDRAANRAPFILGT